MSFVCFLIKVPPSVGPVIVGFPNGSNYYMIRNSITQQKMTCSITGGNPLPGLLWSCYNGITEKATTGQTLDKTVTWTAGRLQSTCLCTARHRLLTEEQTVFVNVKVICKYWNVSIAFFY